VEVKSDFENLCEQYLLGELSDSDRQQLEEAYFAEDDLFERYLIVKEDLIDAYTRGELSAEKRKQFELHFLSSAARAKEH
jgi:anti-sigma factor RsiW